ncbi:MAG TPA: phospholipid scramblase-related protein [Jatrophihabitans sp.]|nr:phospholipid scramblase-related protein [Jatrophihabitans sp.]
MLDLLTVSPLSVVVIDAGPQARYDLRDDRGAAVGSATWQAPSLEGRIRGVFGDVARYPFTVQVHDPAGGLVLRCDKDRDSFYRRRFRVTVRLADGSVVGRVRRAWSLSRVVEFFDDGGARVATAPAGRYSQSFAVTADNPAAAGTAPARVEFGSAGPGAARRFDVEFTADAPVLLRALTLGYLICRDAQLFPQGAAF